MGQIQGSLQNIEVDVTAVGGTAYKTLVCLASSSVNTSADTATDNTNCGVLTSIGNSSMAVDFDAVCEVTPSTSQVTYNTLLSAMVNKTLILIRVQSPAISGSSVAVGAAYYHEFNAYVTALTLTQANTEFIKFSGSFTSTGVLDIIA